MLAGLAPSENRMKDFEVRCPFKKRQSLSLRRRGFGLCASNVVQAFTIIN